MSNIAIVPISNPNLLTARIGGQTCLEHLLGKLREIRDLHEIIFFAPAALLNQIQGVPELPWRAQPHEFGQDDMPMLALREQVAHEGHLKDNFLFVNPAYPLLTGGHIEQALIAVLQHSKGALTVTQGNCFCWKNGSGTAKHMRVGIDACLAIRGDVSVRREDLWCFGDSQQYIPLSDIEAISVASDAGFQMVQSLVLSGEA